ncbi:MAG TPA: RNA 2',3'-cyclic phosphodiesterase [Thermomicrobiales bacterium]|nr:RNA 2',3'-cyclic phosphodiesterase [Thermomicrobiales bacterium]HQZ90622.1 RNA 2',3'-cyclic phosphodiesterase [Thermomicrobiales bacterium]
MVTSGQRQQQRPQSEAAAWRVFAAVPVSDDVRELMRRAEETLAPRGWPMKWVKPELAHLTLKFYGNISTDRLSDLSMRLATVAAGAGALRIRTTTAGAFPSAARPRVIWLGLAGTIDPLAALAARVEAASSGFGKPESRPFAPHITLARLRDGAPAPTDFAAIAAGLNLPSIPFTIDRLQLVRSILGAAGPTYSTVGEWPFSGIPEIDDHG